MLHLNDPGTTHTGALSAGVFFGFLLLAVPAAHAAAPVSEAQPSMGGEGAPLLAPPGSQPADVRARQNELPAAAADAAAPVAAQESASSMPPSPSAGATDLPPAQMTRRPTFASAPANASGNTQPPAAAPDGGYLFTQMQALQEEVMMLRGQVEDQRNQIERLQRDQRERYIDLDRRLSLLSTGGGTTPGPDGNSAAGVGDGETTATEQDLYERAFALTRERDFPAAIDLFGQLVQRYPDGQYAGNAFYWLGEIYLAMDEPDLEQARQQFVQVMTLFPEHRKVPDTLYKLGVVYDRLGEPDQASAYLARVQAEYPGSPAAKLAASYSARPDA